MTVKRLKELLNKYPDGTVVMINSKNGVEEIKNIDDEDWAYIIYLEGIIND